MLAAEIQGLDGRIDGLEAKIAGASSPMIRHLDEIPAFRPLIASAMVAFNPDPRAFRSGSDFSASLGLTPSQHSSGGKEKLGHITKAGMLLRTPASDMHQGQRSTNRSKRPDI